MVLALGQSVGWTRPPPCIRGESPLKPWLAEHSDILRKGLANRMGDVGAPGSQEWGEVLVLKNAVSGNDVQEEGGHASSSIFCEETETGNPR